MALSYNSLSGCLSDKGGAVIRGTDIAIYDCNGEVSNHVNFDNGAGHVPVGAYWDDCRIIVEMSDGSRMYITSVGFGRRKMTN